MVVWIHYLAVILFTLKHENDKGGVGSPIYLSIQSFEACPIIFHFLLQSTNFLLFVKFRMSCDIFLKISFDREVWHYSNGCVKMWPKDLWYLIYMQKLVAFLNWLTGHPKYKTNGGLNWNFIVAFTFHELRLNLRHQSYQICLITSIFLYPWVISFNIFINMSAKIVSAFRYSDNNFIKTTSLADSGS